MDYYVGQNILHQGRYKTVRAIGKDWIETIYLKPNDKGWRKIEKIYPNQKPIWIKMDQYKWIKFDENQKAYLEGIML
jgi:hypothetical protein